MSNFIRKLIKVASLFFLVYASHLQANILISPTKINIADRQRTEKIYLVNNSSKMQTYRLSWEEYAALEGGGYKDLNEKEIASFKTASSMIRFSPKQVTLKPNGKQTVKLAVRRPSNLADGEYRSHLLLTALPPKVKEKKQGDAVETNINILLSYALPVMIKQGSGVSSVSIENIDLFYDKKQGTTEIKVGMSKKGLYSINGDFNVYWTPINSTEEVIVARVYDHTFYHELSNLRQTLKWIGGIPDTGTLRVVYEGRKKNKGKIFAEYAIDVSPSTFKAISN